MALRAFIEDFGPYFIEMSPLGVFTFGHMNYLKKIVVLRKLRRKE